MRRLALLLAVFAFGLVIACGGGDDDGDDGGNGGGNDGGASSSSSNNNNNDSNNNDNDGPGSNGSSGDFCSPDRADAVFNNLDFTDLDPANLEDQFQRMDDILEDWADDAPSEIRDDVNKLVSAMRGLIELLEENDYNFLAIGTSAADDPRFLALDDPEFEAAADRVAEYCGFDTSDPADNGGSTGSSGSTGGGSTGGPFSVDLPDDFPSELVPPNSTLNFAGDAGFGLTVEFFSDATAEEMKDYYEAELGNPTFADSESVLWSAGTRTVTITGSDGDLSIVIIILGD